VRRITWSGRAAAITLFTTTLALATPASPFGVPTASAAAVPAISAAQLADPVFMEAFYRDHFMGAVPPLGFTGEVASCAGGAISAEPREFELTRLNAYRAIAGVGSGVIEDTGFEAGAQAAAVAIAAQHDGGVPEPGEPCAAPGALDALADSALGAVNAGRPPLASEAAIDQAIDLPVSAAPLQDRDALLQPSLDEVTIAGATYPGTPTSVVLFRRDAPTATSWPAVRDPDGLVAWPPCGAAVPYPLVHAMWSVARPGLDTNAATLTVTRNGQPVSADWYEHRAPGSPEESSNYSVTEAMYGLLQPAPGATDEFVVRIDGATQDGVPTDISCSFNVIDVNVGPIDLLLSDNGVRPHEPAGTVVGALIPYDVLGYSNNGVRSEYTFELVDGPGDDDNDQFSIVGGELLTSAQLVRVEGTRTVRVKVTENRPGEPFERALSVVVAREREPLGPITPTEMSVMENLPGGTLVASFPATDANGFPITYTMDPAPGRSTDLVNVAGNEVRTTRPLDFERDRQQRFYVTASNGTYTATAVITLQILDEPEAPSQPAITFAPAGRPGELLVTWTAPERGAPVEHYTISWLGSSIVVDASVLSHRLLGLPEGGDVTVTVTATNRFGSASDTDTARVGTRATWPTAYTPVAPARLLDTRPHAPIGYGGPKPEAGSVVEVQIAGREGVPADAEAVALNVTITDATAAGYVTAYPAGTAPPNVSNLNVGDGGTVANSVIVKVGAGGKVALYTERGGHLIVDVAGYWRLGDAAGTGAGRLLSLQPSRVLDTRSALGAAGALGAGGTVRLSVTGVGGVPTSGVSAVALNLTATQAEAPGYLTVWAGGTARPNASNLNLTGAGQTLANQVIVPIGADGTIEIYSERGSHVIVDLTGYVTDATAPVSRQGMFVPLAPFRRIDTRSRTSPVSAGDMVEAFENVPMVNGKWIGEIAGFALNVTATDTAGAGFVSVYPCVSLEPRLWQDASTLNVNGPGETVPNAAIAATGSQRDVCVTPSVASHLIVDVFGYFLWF
jgi:hypothetical protein